jgi:hypothetical protein
MSTPDADTNPTVLAKSLRFMSSLLVEFQLRPKMQTFLTLPFQHPTCTLRLGFYVRQQRLERSQWLHSDQL